MRRGDPDMRPDTVSPPLHVERYVRSLIAEMPKVELHLHLDGALRVATALDLAATARTPERLTYREMHDRMVLAGNASSQAELLEAFTTPVELLQTSGSLERAARELVVDKHHDRVVYLEIKWAPALHTRQGLTLPEVIEAVATGARDACDATGCIARLVPVLLRTHDPASNRDVVAAAAAMRAFGVAGIDLAGDEAANPTVDDHRPALLDALDAGLGITVHAGEIADGLESMSSALSLPLDRIEHGASVAPGSDLAEVLRRRDITLDMCPTSNVQAATVPGLVDHPIVRLHRDGVQVTVSTDDPTISAVTQTDEMWNVWRWCGASLAELWAMNRAAVDAAFVDDDVRSVLTGRLDDWELLVPDVLA